MNTMHFPKYNPNYEIRMILDKLFQGDRNGNNINNYYKRIRNSCLCFTKKQEVRDYLMKRDGYKCVICNSTNNLQIDHIKSVYSAVYKNTDPYILNTEQNLRVLCGRCNAKQTP